MVKADPRHDYYADLDCQPGATADEIKKQFKKLALKYHPDRNPGKELEFNSKFQEIQSANEILTDTAQRAKYDADRIRSGLFHTYASPTRPNMPPRSPATNYPPPPPRPPPPTATKPNFPPPPTGTNRYSAYAKAEAAKSRPNPEGDDAQTRANAFKAWEQMRHGQGPPPTRKVPPRPERTNFQPRHAANGVSEDPPPRRTAYEQFQDAQSSMPRMARSQTQRVPKSSGFNSGSKGGDVHSGQSTSTYAYVRPDRPHRVDPQYAQPYTQGQRKADPLRAFKSQVEAEDFLNNSDRISTPYATAGGEKTYFSSHGLGTAGNSRERRASAEWYESESAMESPQPRAPSSTSDRQHHSASPKMRTPKQVSPSSSSSSTSSSDESNTFTQRPFGTRRTQLRNPTTAKPKPILKPSVKVDSFENAGPSQTGQPGLRSSWTDGLRKPQAQEPIKSDQPEGFLQHRMKRESLRNSPNQRPSHAEQKAESSIKTEHPLQRPRSWNEQYGMPKENGGKTPSMRPQTGGQTGQGPIFNFPSNEAKKPFGGTTPLRSHSSESINTNFSPSHWNGKFTSGKEYFEAPQQTQNNVSAASRTPPPGARPVPVPPPPSKQEQGTANSAPTSGVHANTDTSTTNSSSTAQPSPLDPLNTTKEDWTQHFKPATWQYPPSATGSPVRGMSKKRAKTPRKYSKIPSKRPQTANVTDPAEEVVDDAAAAGIESLSSRTSGDESAMDIDPVLTPPSGQSNGEQRSSTHLDRTVTGTEARPRGPPVPPRQGNQTSKTPQDLNLSDIKNVAPLAPNAEGIKNMDDLTTSLPFESRPAANATRDPPPQALELPHPPKAPLQPSTLTQTSWERYLAQMRSYMFEWNSYNSRMLAHFTERQSNVGTLDGGWMSSVGDKGYKQYMQGIEEDFRVRQHWDVSWETHRECIRGLGAVRERMLGSKTGA